MKTTDFDYFLPRNLIAQHPVRPRDSSRMMVIDRKSETIRHRYFYDLPEFLVEGDTLVFNDSRVIPARLRGIGSKGQDIVIILLEKKAMLSWKVLFEVGRLDSEGTVSFTKPAGLKGIITGMESENTGVMTFNDIDLLETGGEMPLPPYIYEPLGSNDEYQTVYSKILGSAAAPTAGLHFTKNLLNKLKDMGINLCFVTLHVGMDTFMPVHEDNPEEHVIHKEYFEVSNKVTKTIVEAKERGSRVITVGTTSTRVLEQGKDGMTEGWADIFILPGYEFKVVDSMITNFHLPRSTNLMMITAFAGFDLVRKAYREAVRLKYRFYSFGDSMLIL